MAIPMAIASPRAAAIDASISTQALDTALRLVRGFIRGRFYHLVAEATILAPNA